MSAGAGPDAFRSAFDHGTDRPDFVGLSRRDAEARAADLGFTPVRVVVVPQDSPVAWRADHRSRRLNLVVRDDRVVRAGLF